MKSCKNCIHHLVCPQYAPLFDDILEDGKPCSEFIDKNVFEECQKQNEVLKCRINAIFGIDRKINDSFIKFTRRLEEKFRHIPGWGKVAILVVEETLKETIGDLT